MVRARGAPIAGFKEADMARVKLNWVRDPRLAELKTLALMIWWRRQSLNARGLWQEVDQVCEAVFERLTGEPGWTLVRLNEYALETQGLEVTSDKLWQRVDKALRYGETTGPETERRVLAAYEAALAARAA
jgi:hypothetical protein